MPSGASSPVCSKRVDVLSRPSRRHMPIDLIECRPNACAGRYDPLIRGNRHRRGSPAGACRRRHSDRTLRRAGAYRPRDRVHDPHGRFISARTAARAAAEGPPGRHRRHVGRRPNPPRQSRAGQPSSHPRRPRRRCRRSRSGHRRTRSASSCRSGHRGGGRRGKHSRRRAVSRRRQHPVHSSTEGACRHNAGRARPAAPERTAECHPAASEAQRKPEGVSPTATGARSARVGRWAAVCGRHGERAAGGVSTANQPEPTRSASHRCAHAGSVDYGPARPPGVRVVRRRRVCRKRPAGPRGVPGAAGRP